MIARKRAAKHATASPAHADCPHCRGVNTLGETRETHVDTADVHCTVWRCAACGYEEGRSSGVAG